MRTSLFLSTLFAASLIGGAALAEKPADASRAHGDVFDKSYKTPSSEHVTHDATSEKGSTTTTNVTHSPAQQREASRINCSDTGADCSAAPASKTHAMPGEAASSQSSRSQAKNPLDKRADERVNCNEGDECSASSKGMKGIWSKSRGGGETMNSRDQAKAEKIRATLAQIAHQDSSARTSCNEGDECSFSSVEAKKIFRTEAFKHGTVDMTKPGLNLTDAERASKQRMTAEKYDSAADKASKASSHGSADHSHDASSDVQH